MQCGQRTLFPKVLPDLIKRGVRIILNIFAKLNTLLGGENGNPMSSWQGSKPVVSLAFTNPSADTADMIPKYLGKMLPAGFP